MDGRGGLLRGWARLLRRRWATGLVLFALVVGTGVAFLLLSHPVYRSEASLRLGEPPPAGGVSPSGGVFSFLQLGGDPFANDLELLASRTVAEGVVGEVSLNAVLEAPRDVHRDSLFLDFRASRDTRRATFEVRYEGEDGIRARLVAAPDDEDAELPGPVVEGQVGRPLTLDGLTLVLRPWREGLPREFEVRTVPFAEATRVFRSALAVERPRREANVVAVAYDHTDPAVALAGVRAAVAEFVGLRAALQEQESDQTSDSLRRVADRTAGELREAETSLETFQRRSRIVAPEAQSEALVERQTELLSRLQRARGELAAVEEMLGRLDAVTDPARSWTALMSNPVFLDNPTLSEVLARLTGLQAQRQELATRRSPANRELAVLDEQIAYLDGSLRELAREYRRGLREQVATLEPELDELEALLGELPGRAVELGRRERDVRLLSEILLLTEQRLRQEELREALTYANVQEVDPPALRDRPVWPRKALGLAVVLLLAGGTALTGMVVRDRTDPVVRTAEDVEALLDAPLLGVLSEQGGRGPIRPSPAEVAALLRPLPADAPARGLLLVSADGGDEARRLADGLAEAGDGSGPTPKVEVEPAVRTFADGARVAAAPGVPVVVARVGRTRDEALLLTRRLVEEAGGTVEGVLLVTGPGSGRVWR